MKMFRRHRAISLTLGLSSSSGLSRSFSSTINGQSWNHISVEWSPMIDKLLASNDEILEKNSHFVYPDLPEIYTPDFRQAFVDHVEDKKQIQTIAACQYENWQSLVESARELTTQHRHGYKTRLLIVGGNNKMPGRLSSAEALRILRLEMDSKVELWAVADPNSRDSILGVHDKVQAGAEGFITQPILTSKAWETVNSYKMGDASLIIGIAFPRSAKSLRFWQQLMDNPNEFDKDPLFLSHLAYFSQPYTTSLAWVGREINNVVANSFSDNQQKIAGLHLMPLQNSADFLTIVKSLPVLK